MANIIPVHEDKVSGPNTAITSNTLTMKVFGMRGEKRRDRGHEAFQRRGIIHFNVTWLRRGKASLSDKIFYEVQPFGNKLLLCFTLNDCIKFTRMF